MTNINETLWPYHGGNKREKGNYSFHELQAFRTHSKNEIFRNFFDSKFNCTEHIVYISGKCTKLIHTLSKPPKQSWGLSRGTLYTVHKGAILQLLLYGAPVWIESLEEECNKTVYSRVQRLINITKTKAFRTSSSEAFCTLTGLTPFVIKAEEEAKL